MYSSKIIKSGALIADTKALLAHWDEERTAAENLAQSQQSNVLGKESRARIEDILAIFRQRYVQTQEILSFFRRERSSRNRETREGKVLDRCFGGVGYGGDRETI